MEKKSKIYVAGHTGMVGSAIVRKLQNDGYENLVLKTRAELDLLNQGEVIDFFQKEQPEYVILAAARVGGIKANMTYPADFLYENLEMQNNIIWTAHKAGVRKLLFLGSSCVYPRECPQPMKEEYLLDGKVEPTNEGYALAKISGIKLCEMIYRQFGEKFISCMPTNIYGYNDNFSEDSSHVIPALIRRMHNAKINSLDKVEIWGSGSTCREFLFVDELADACIFLMNNYDQQEIINVGTGKDLSIKELAEKIKEIVDFRGNIVWDTTKPDGNPKKLLDVSKLKSIGWEAKVDLDEGLKNTYNWFLNNYENLRK